MTDEESIESENEEVVEQETGVEGAVGCIQGDVCVWKIFQGENVYEMKLDRVDFEEAIRLKLKFHMIHKYPATNLGKCEHPYVHSWVFERVDGHISEGYVVDHINGDRLDNTRRNLRAITPRANAQNRVKKTIGATSKYFGVSKFQGRNNVTWNVQLSKTKDRPKKLSATFNKEEHAAYKYNLMLDSVGDQYSKRNDIKCPEDFVDYIPVGRKEYATQKKSPVQTEPVGDGSFRVMYTYKGEQKYALLDRDKCAELVDNCYKVHHRVHDGYTGMKVDGINMLMHRWVMGLNSGDSAVVNHLNGIRTDNRRCNLELTTRQGNAQNITTPSTALSGHRGIVKKKNKWEARISVNKTFHFLGSYDTLAAAIVARKEGEERFRGRSSIIEK